MLNSRKKCALLMCFLVLVAVCSGYILAPRPYQVHYHANVSVYIDGVKWDFSDTKYMEETSRCGVGDTVRPEDRIHLHDNKGDLVHVHMAGSTWGDLFSNIGWQFSMNYLVPDNGEILTPESGKSLIYILNGQSDFNPWNTAVMSEDRLLVWYGTGTEAEILEKFSEMVPSDAHEYNSKDDPASCSINSSGIFATIFQRIHDLVSHKHE